MWPWVVFEAELWTSNLALALCKFTVQKLKHIIASKMAMLRGLSFKIAKILFSKIAKI